MFHFTRTYDHGLVARRSLAGPWKVRLHRWRSWLRLWPISTWTHVWCSQFVLHSIVTVRCSTDSWCWRDCRVYV